MLWSLKITDLVSSYTMSFAPHIYHLCAYAGRFLPVIGLGVNYSGGFCENHPTLPPRGQILYMTVRPQGDDCDTPCACVCSYRSDRDVLINYCSKFCVSFSCLGIWLNMEWTWKIAPKIENFPVVSSRIVTSSNLLLKCAPLSLRGIWCFIFFSDVD
jgi:hypothetical protein